MLDDLGLTIDDFKVGRTLYLVCSILAIIPSQLLNVRFKPATWMCLQMVFWSAILALQSTLHGPWSYWSTRAITGLVESGFRTFSRLLPELLLHIFRASSATVLALCCLRSFRYRFLLWRCIA